jgi:hypothetical protein
MPQDTPPIPPIAAVQDRPPVPVPDREEIAAAVRTLVRAWAPGTLLPGDPGYDQVDDDDPDGGCGCAGDDEHGESRGCNCGDGCTCTRCEASDWMRSKRCSAGAVSIGTRCTAPTKYRITAYRIQRAWRQADPGTVCAHPPQAKCPCRPGFAFEDLGEEPVTHQRLTACSARHARDVIEQMTKAYGEPADKPRRLRFYAERWTYELHRTELPEHTAALREAVRSAADALLWATREPQGYTRVPASDPGSWNSSALIYLARATWHAAQDPGEPEDPDEDSPGGSTG